MTGDHAIVFVFGVLAVQLALFVWNGWRYDLVALLGLLALVLGRVIPAPEAFSGFGHPAVIMVAAVLVLSRALQNAGVVDQIARAFSFVGERPSVQVAALTGACALCSAVMNNIGALALFMPVAVSLARQADRSPSFVLMPLAFASLLGGTITLIGTPANLIIATYREESGAAPFGMFDFVVVGAAISVAGVLLMAIVGWRLAPRRKEAASADLFEIGAYVTEVRIPEGSKHIGRTLRETLATAGPEAEVVVLALVRGGRRRPAPPMYEVLAAGDLLLIEAAPDVLGGLLDRTGLALAEGEHGPAVAGGPPRAPLDLIECVVGPTSRLIGRTPVGIDLRGQYGVNVLAVARRGQRMRDRLSRTRFLPGDILLVQGQGEALQMALAALGCLPLLERGLRIGRPRRVLLAAGLFAATIACVALQWVPAEGALVAGAVAMILARQLTLDEAYDALDLPVLVLLAAMIPVGHAVERTGGAALVADRVLAVAGQGSPAVAVGLLLVGTMALSNVVNNAAAAILVAPIALKLARSMALSPDPFLMAVCVGASCAFLTPIGHQSNALVMAPGGYRFGDYWRVGAPLSLVVLAVSLPLILWAWPPG